MTCDIIAYAKKDDVGFCICILENNHAGKHKCICRTEWTDEEAPPQGKA